MAIRLKHKKSGRIYIFLGAGYGAYKTAFAGNWLQSLAPQEEDGEVMMVAVCTEEGEIRWGKSADFVVVDIDGRTPQGIIDEVTY